MDRVRAQAADIIRWWPQLGDEDWHAPGIEQTLNNIAKQEEQEEKRRCIDRWEKKMERDDKALLEWIRREEKQSMEFGDITAPTCPQEAAEAFRQELHGLLSPGEVLDVSRREEEPD